ncbi:hypothetical protein GCM10017581_010250 [Dactylosporangium matsuzakiense]|uniref:EAL domain-containing protein n=2 Tax=Dactylosporangium matsuzakiense TaxID=53360 RepID=A0A9W6KFU8_9ACTN|nr:hypothetical protein GCM10017581_010250 [Dactylosporangium matsuzakiense]
MADGEKRPRGFTLWSRSGYRGPSHLKPSDSAPQLAPDQLAPIAAADAAAPGPAALRVERRPAAGGGSLIEQVIADRSVDIDFQPIFDTDRNEIVGFEAFTRGPEGPLRSPVNLFGAARAAGRLGELDWVCRAAAFRRLLDAGLPPSISLVVNVEADSLLEPCPPDLLPIIVEAEQRLRVIVDLPGRVISRYPRQALETARKARAAEWGVAINGIEFSAAGAALLPSLEPDVVKLNHQLINSGLNQASNALITVMAECERTGAAMLVERVEDRDAAMVARAAGAGYQQGYLLGKPGPLPDRLASPHAPFRLLMRDDAETTAQTPWDVLAAASDRQVTAVTQAALNHLIVATATQASSGDYAPAVAAVIPAGAAAQTPQQQALFTMLLERCPLIIIIGPDVSAWGDWRVHTADTPAGHPLTMENCFIVLSPIHAVAIAARPHERAAAASEPLWDLRTSQNPTTCRAVMHTLLSSLDEFAGDVHHPDSH